MKIFLGIICATALSITIAQSHTSTSETTTTSTTTENTGVIAEFTPGATIVLSTGTGEPVHYTSSAKALPT